jgi:hypothetical protein
MLEKHSVFEIPAEGTVLWRYMDAMKLFSMLRTSALFFPRADIFEDKFEGSTPYVVSRLKSEEHYSLLPGWFKNNPERLRQQMEGDLRSRRHLRAQYRKCCFILSWHARSAESLPMWKLYSSHNNGVAIKVDSCKLMAAFEEASEKIFFGKVHYVDYLKDGYISDGATIFDPFVHKRIEFEDEREYRAIVFITPDEFIEDNVPAVTYDFSNHPEFGINVNVDFKDIIEEVVVCPGSPDWVYETLKDISVTYGLKCLISRSKLDHQPLFE